MIKFISTDDTLDLRSSGLRWGIARELCGFEGDDDPDTFHAGYYLEGNLVSIATFHMQSREGMQGKGYQLRGMVTHTDHQGKGLGNQLLNFCIVYLRGQKADYLWCNAREIAYKFYLGLGFEFISDEFQIEKIGPHRVMYLKIN